MRAVPPDRRRLAAGAAGSVLLTVGSFGVGALPRAFGQEPGWLGLTVLRASTLSRALCTLLAVVGVLLLLHSWYALRAAPARVQLRAFAVWGLPLLLAPPLFSRDLYAYAAQGQQLVVGADPYRLGPVTTPGPLADSVSTQWAGSASPYGPVFLALARAAVSLTGQHPQPAVLLLRLLAVAGLLLVAWSLVRLVPGAAGPALWLGLTNPLVLLHGVGGGHNEALMGGLMLAGLAVGLRVTRPQRALGAVLVTLGALVKLPALAALAVLPDRQPPRAFLRQAAAVGVVAVAVAGLAGTVTGLGSGWLRTSLGGGGQVQVLSPAYVLGHLLRAVGVGDGMAVGRTVATLLGAAAAGAVLLAAPRLGRLRALGWAMVLVAFTGPQLQPWYLLWGLFPLAATADERTRRALAAASTVLCLTLLPGGTAVLPVTTLGLPAAFAVTAGVVAWRRTPARSAPPARVTGSLP